MLQYSRLFSMFRCFNIPIFFECFRRQGLDRGGRRFFSICATSRFAMFPFSVSMFPCFNITINHMVRCFNTPIIIVVRLSDKLHGSMFRHYGSLFQYSDTVMIWCFKIPIVLWFVFSISRYLSGSMFQCSDTFLCSDRIGPGQWQATCWGGWPRAASTPSGTLACGKRWRGSSKTPSRDCRLATLSQSRQVLLLVSHAALFDCGCSFSFVTQRYTVGSTVVPGPCLCCSIFCGVKYGVGYSVMVRSALLMLQHFRMGSSMEIGVRQMAASSSSIAKRVW